MLKGTTLMPGMIEGHSHLLLHPYNETAWNDQVLREPLALRVARGRQSRARDADGRHHHGARSRHRRRRLRGRRTAPGDQRRHHSRPAHARGRTGDGRDRQLCAEGLRAGSDRAAGRGGSRRPRRRDARGARPDRARRRFRSRSTPTIAGARTAKRGRASRSKRSSASSRPPTAAAGRSWRTPSTAEGMRRAIMGGVETIEHGDEGTPEIWKLMVEKNVAFCPTLAAGDATSQYAGWKKGVDPEPARIARKRADLQGRARCRREDVFRRRRRRLRARRQRARARADGGLAA